MITPNIEEWYGRELSKLALSEGHRGGIPGESSSLEEQQEFRDNLGKYRPVMECVSEGPVYFRTIQRLTEIKLATLQRWIKKLETLGYVTTTKKKNRNGLFIKATLKGLEELEAYDGTD